MYTFQSLGSLPGGCPMTSQFSSCDEYGFLRSKGFDAVSYEEFMSSYLRTLSRRGLKWEKLVRGAKPGNSEVYAKLSYGAKLKRFVRKGIPGPHRKGVWLQVSGAQRMRAEEPDLYPAMLALETVNQVNLDQIVADMPRTFPDNAHFDSTNPASLQTPLLRILRAMANSNPKVGYCQGLNYVGGLLLLATRDEEATFWLLKALTERILPEYYAPAMPGLLVDIRVLAVIARQEVPRVAAHIDKLGMPWALLASKWFICLFADVLPVETVLRVWDCLFAEGSKVLFRVALALLKLNESRLLSRTEFADLAEELKAVVAGSKEVLHCHDFLASVYAMPMPGLTRGRLARLRAELGEEVREEELERERRRRVDNSGMRDG